MAITMVLTFWLKKIQVKYCHDWLVSVIVYKERNVANNIWIKLWGMLKF